MSQLSYSHHGHSHLAVVRCLGYPGLVLGINYLKLAMFVTDLALSRDFDQHDREILIGKHLHMSDTANK